MSLLIIPSPCHPGGLKTHSGNGPLTSRRGRHWEVALSSSMIAGSIDQWGCALHLLPQTVCLPTQEIRNVLQEELGIPVISRILL
jgi:hypothetical protein